MIVMRVSSVPFSLCSCGILILFFRASVCLALRTACFIVFVSFPKNPYSEFVYVRKVIFLGKIRPVTFLFTFLHFFLWVYYSTLSAVLYLPVHIKLDFEC